MKKNVEETELVTFSGVCITLVPHAIHLHCIVGVTAKGSFNKQIVLITLL